jgi:polysaccharide deacetylase 2 family uncharacterized protein YibQ
MPKKTTSRKRKSNRKKAFQGSLTKAVAGIVLVAVVVAICMLAIRLLAPPHRSPGPPKSAKVQPAVKTPVRPHPVPAPVPDFEIFPETEPPKKKPAQRPVPALPKVAIIIDDLGYDRKMAEKFIFLGVPLTVAVLPHSPQQKNIARLAKENGLETMLHLPMEPIEYPQVDPGPGTLLTSMLPDDLIRSLKDNLDSVPDIKGVNNHMGSKMTAAAPQMNQIFSVLKERRLFFIDSRTTNDTVCRSSAKLFQLPFGQRDVFLDHEPTAGFVRKQIRLLIRIAQRNGTAVGIGHPHRTTYRTLREMLPELQEKVRLVPASEVVQQIG